MTEHDEREERRRRSIELLNQIQRRADEVLAENADVLAEFEKVTREFCIGQAENRTFARRPQLGFKLVCEGDPPARIAVRPNWSRHRKQVLFDHINVELMIERKLNAEGATTVDRGFGLAFNRGIPQGTLWAGYCPDGAERMVGTIRGFLADPAAVFARSADNCCICGRRLTDDTSRTRGIGPECIQTIRFFPVLWDSPTSLLDRMPVRAPAARSTQEEVQG